MTYAAKILADSLSPAGHRLTTFEVTFPRIVLAEFNTHRQFSRNSASSRAIPVKKMLDRVQKTPFVPAAWGKNQKGMQAADEVLTGKELDEAVFCWRESRNHAMNAAHRLAVPTEEGGLDVHKQIANRLLEPWLWHTVIVTATEWGNFWNLRDNKMAQPEIYKVAGMMHELYKANAPRLLKYHEWHLPLFEPGEVFDVDVIEGLTAAKISAGRCARVSYLTHDGKRDQREDIRLHDSLLASGHMSPLEHPARPMDPTELDLFARADKMWDAKAGYWVWPGTRSHFCGNFNGWVQLRKLVPGEADIHTYRSTVA